MHMQACIALAGNPNCGKTTLFNALTGARQRVGNWPGVTLDKKEGSFTEGNLKVKVVDLPGLYSLATPQNAPLDEAVARRFILSGGTDLIVNILDAANLERNLYLTAQLAEMGIPMILALNMMDTAVEDGIAIDVGSLSASLGCPVVPLVARREEGIRDLKLAIAQALTKGCQPCAKPSFAAPFEAALRQLVPIAETFAQAQHLDVRWMTTRMIEGDESIAKLAPPQLVAQASTLRQELETQSGDDASMLAADARFGFANALARSAITHQRRASATFSDRVDKVVLGRWLGLPVFLAVLYCVFLLSINVSGIFIDFLDQAAGAILVAWPAHLLAHAGLPDMLNLVVKAIGSGLQTVATFIPIVGMLFLCLTALEDSGYMARAAFVMDRAMRKLGLPGKAFLPMILGFGCTVPAVMATRTLESRDDRLVVTAMAPFMSCGARLPVYALFAAAFFPSGGQNVVFGLYLLGITIAILTGLAIKSTLLKSEPVYFIMELPHYHLPTAKGLMIGVWERLKSFIIDAGRVIVVVVAILNVLNTVGTDGTLGNEYNGRSVLAAASRSLTPVLRPLGITDDNWPAAVGLFTGIFAKEAVVGTLDTLYGSLSQGSKPPVPAADFSLTGALASALATIPANAEGLLSELVDPLGIAAAGDVEATSQNVASGTFGAMVERFDGKAGAFAYLVFILLYVPCSAAISAIYRETGPRWTMFIILWTTGLAYMASVFAYQVATFARQPSTALIWLAAIPSVLLAILLVMRHSQAATAIVKSPETVP